MPKIPNFRIVFSIILLLLCCWVVVYRIDAVPMNLWDESRQANNALEMMQSGNWYYTTYNGQPDFWNTKPHLLVVLQALAMKFLGPGLLALRLPSAIAACLTLVVWFVFLYKSHGFDSAGFFVLILVTCGGFNTYHVARTGDYDALLLLFISLATIRFFRIADGSAENSDWIQAGIWIALSALTKSVAVLLWAPSWLVLLILSKQFRVGHLKNWLFMLLIPIVSVFVYYGYREWLTPGYLQAVWENEWVGRYARPNEGHITQPWYYFGELWNRSFAWFVVLLPIPFFWPLKTTESREKWSVLLVALLFLLFTSISATRISWYAAPVLPLFCWLLVIPFSVYALRTRFLLLYTAFIGLAAVFGFFYNLGANTQTHGVRSEWLLLQIDRGEKKPPANKWLVSRYAPVENYYNKRFKQKGIAMDFVQLNECRVGDSLIVGHELLLNELNLKYNMSQIQAPSKINSFWLIKIVE